MSVPLMSFGWHVTTRTSQRLFSEVSLRFWFVDVCESQGRHEAVVFPMRRQYQADG